MNTLPAAAGALLDRLLGEPPARWHPVIHFGTAMRRLEDHLYADRRINGTVFTAMGVGAAIGVGLGLRNALGRSASTTIATAVCVAGRMLDIEARGVAELLERNDLTAARHALRSLVGRTTDELDAAEISRAVIESLAENCVDAVTGSLFWASVGGAPAVLAHRAVNTLDAMVGHRTTRYERFGWASARLDDLANFVPARLTATAVALARPGRARSIWRTVHRDAHRHPSPNGGVVEAAFAAALGVRLGGINRYADRTDHRGVLGDGPRPTTRAIDRAIHLRGHTTTATVAVLAAVTAAVAPSTTRRPPARRPAPR